MVNRNRSELWRSYVELSAEIFGEVPESNLKYRIGYLSLLEKVQELESFWLNTTKVVR